MKPVYTFILFFFSFLNYSIDAQTIINISDASIGANDKVRWTKNNVYLCDGLVFVEPGAELSIEAGTVVKFTPRADVGNPSALVITRGAKIFAEGSSNEPIIFTAEADDINNPSDLGPTDNALWGGIVILGNGLTQKNGNGEVSVEGISTSEPRGLYGGNNNDDNSGILRYISIRHGGRQIASGSELNGLTLGAVGSKTTLEYIEIYANSDDGIEFFGGAPNLKYAVVAFAEDDSFDWDEVYVGKGQFWFSIQRADIADNGGEFDGTTPDDASPYSNGTVYNWTHIGSGKGAAAGNPNAWLLRAGTAGTIANSIVIEQKSKVLEVQDKNAPTNDAHQKLVNGELKILNNVFFNNGGVGIDTSSKGIIRITSGNPTKDDPAGLVLIKHLNDNQNIIEDPKISNVSRSQDKKLDPRPANDGAAYKSSMANLPANDAFFKNVNYKGAFSNNSADLWLAKWSTLDRNNHLGIITSVNKVVSTNYKWLEVFPNPSQGNLSMLSHSDEIKHVQIFNLHGQIVFASNIQANVTVDVTLSENIANGVYLVKAIDNKGNYQTIKIMIEKI